MDARANYYRILHVQSDAPLEIIKTSYRTLMQRMKMHPDLGGDHEAAMLINEAYATLSNPERRAEYDRELAEIAAHARAAAEQAAADAAEPAAAPEPAAEAPQTERAADPAGAAKPEPGCCTFCNTRHEPSAHSDFQYCRSCDSPMRPVIIQRPSGTARRAIERMPKRLPLRYFCKSDPDTGHSGRMINISPGGVRFAADAPLPVGTVIRIECATCSAVARVSNSTAQAPFEIGVEFLTLEFRANTGSFVSIVA